MLQLASEHRLDAIGSALRKAAHRHGASVQGEVHIGQHLRTPRRDALSFSISAPELYSALLEAEIRMSLFLPCRVAAYTAAGGVELETVSPLDFCRVLNRPDLTPLAAPLESLLRAIMEDAATEAPAAMPAERAAPGAGSSLGATEEQMNARGAIPQRIDAHGTKVEDLGGTGEHDTQGG